MKTPLKMGVLTLLLFLTSCALHLRSTKDWPSALNPFYLQTPSEQLVFREALVQTLTGMQVKVVAFPDQSHYQLLITDMTLSHNMPVITTAYQPTTYTYVMSLVFSIRDAANHFVVAPQRLEAAESVIINANQLLTDNVSALVSQRLQQVLLDRLILKLGTRPMLEALTRH